MKNFRWRNSVWFLDVDDTVLDTDGAHEAGSAALQAELAAVLGPSEAQRLVDRFNRQYWLIRAGYSAKEPADWEKVPGGQKAYEDLLDQIRSYQPEVIKQYGTAKLWSREVLLKLCADGLSIQLPGELIGPLVGIFWDGVAQHSSVLPDASELISAIRRRTCSVHLFTSSDGRLHYDTNRQSFWYEPEESRRLKDKRIERHRSQGLDFDTLTISDPFDKPDPRGFQSMLGRAQEFLGRPVEPQDCVMVGDSYSGDLAVPHEKLGFGLSVWYRPKQPAVEWLDDTLVSVPDLRAVAGFFSNETV